MRVYSCFVVIAASPTTTRRSLGALIALATASFCYVTAETLPIGLLPQMARGLNVSDSQVGLLLTIYAAVAGLSAIPLTALTVHLPRHVLMYILVGVFAISQLATAVAPTYGWLVAARLLCALTHGVFWSIVAPVATRLAGSGRSARGTAIVFAGSSLAIVLGTPIGTAVGNVFGWRVAMAVVGVAGAASVAALVVKLPRLSGEADAVGAIRALTAIPDVLRNRLLATVCVTTVVLVIGNFTAYTYISLIVKRDSGLHGIALASVLLAYGAAGVIGNAVVSPMVDARPRRAMIIATGGVGVALVLLSAGSGVPLTVAAVLVWGFAAVAAPVALQTAVLRVAPTVRDTASAVYVVAFQIGIGGGALLGGLFVSHDLIGELSIVGSVTAAGALALVLTSVRAFPRSVPEDAVAS
jgi:predicted MFS family arabinose efflux permease